MDRLKELNKYNENQKFCQREINENIKSRRASAVGSAFSFLMGVGLILGASFLPSNLVFAVLIILLTSMGISSIVASAFLIYFCGKCSQEIANKKQEINKIEAKKKEIYKELDLQAYNNKLQENTVVYKPQKQTDFKSAIDIQFERQ